MTLRARVALVTGTAVVVAVVALSALTWGLGRSAIQRGLAAQVADVSAVLGLSNEAGVSADQNELCAQLRSDQPPIPRRPGGIQIEVADTCRLNQSQPSLAAEPLGLSSRWFIDEVGGVRIIIPAADEHAALVLIQRATLVGAILVIGLAVGLAWAAGVGATRQVSEFMDDVVGALSDPKLQTRVEQVTAADLAPLARAANAALDDLALADETNALLVADAAHGLRTPVAGLRANIQILGHVSASGDDEQSALIRDIDRQSVAVVRIVDDLIDIARLRGLQPAYSGPVRLDEIVLDSVESWAHRYPGQRITVDISPHEVEGDPGLVRRALDNLIDNAVRYGKGGPIDVRQHEAMIEVVDSGPGIARELVDEVVQPFRRGQTDIAGSGLGLALVQRVMEVHGGKLQISASEKGRGACIRLIFRGAPNSQSSPS